jgi:ankyrin repeat protein
MMEAKKQISPHERLSELAKFKTIPALHLQNFFLEHTAEQIDAYDNEVAKAIRSSDLEKLREMVTQGRPLQSSNRFGESLIHMACRRGATDVVRLLIEEANVSVKVCDDFGRTPMHDACWACEPQLELMELLLEQCPTLIFICDKRGFSPLQYVRREHWPVWISFINSHGDRLKNIDFPDEFQAALKLIQR